MARPRTWINETKMIRLPTKFEAEIVEYAHRLENGEQAEETDFDAKLAESIAAVLQTVPPRDRGAASKLFNKLSKKMKSDRP